MKAKSPQLQSQNLSVHEAPSPQRSRGSRLRLKATLDRFVDNFHYESHLAHDPVQFLYRYNDDRDREVAGLFAAALAYGNVTQILRTLDHLFKIMGPSPHRFVVSFSRSRAASLSAFYHRFNTSRDVIALSWAVRAVLREFGSLQSLFLAGNDPDATTIESGLDRFAENILRRVPPALYDARRLPAKAGVRFLISSPASGSACKRMNLYLRWMVRPEPVDFRIWRGVSPRQLVLPVDTHIARIGRYIGLTGRRTIGWKTALEMTASLRSLNTADPVRYDFALCHLGIMRGCPSRYNPAKCAICPIESICML